MRFRRILRDQVVQTVDLLEIFLCLMVPVIVVKGVLDYLAQGQLFWLDYIILLAKSVVGFIGLSILCDLFEVARRYRSR
ncbi:hypothetical protein [Levilactobacillus sp. HBUAS70063]|uniref:hypothetical protein n=1 Tax=Levilactobacillus sp. HBUAS70063 TaxID=3109359 RepID=UPI003132B925